MQQGNKIFPVSPKVAQLSSRSFNLIRELELRRNLIDQIINGQAKFEDEYYWLHLLGRPPELNYDNEDFQSLKELSLYKISSKNYQKLDKDFEQIFTLHMKNQELMFRNQYETIMNNIESKMQHLKSIKSTLNISKFEDDRLNMERQNQRDEDLQAELDDLKDFKRCGIDNTDIDDRQQPYCELDEEEEKIHPKEQDVNEDRWDTQTIQFEQEKEPAKSLKLEPLERISYKKAFPLKQEREQILLNPQVYRRQNPEYEMILLPWTQFLSNLKANIKELTDNELQIQIEEDKELEVVKQVEEKEQDVFLTEEYDQEKEEEMTFSYKRASNAATKDSLFVPIDSSEISEVSMIHISENEEESFSSYDLTFDFLKQEFEKPDKKKNSIWDDVKPS